MTIPTLVERTPDGFRASTATLPELAADGSTAADALAALQALVVARSAGRDDVAGAPTPPVRPPLSDATWAKFRTSIEQYREEREAEELAAEADAMPRPARGN